MIAIGTVISATNLNASESYIKKKNIYIKDVPCFMISIKHSKKRCIDWLSFFSICVLLKRIYLNAMQTFTALDD